MFKKSAMFPNVRNLQITITNKSKSLFTFAHFNTPFLDSRELFVSTPISDIAKSKRECKDVDALFLAVTAR